MSKVCRVIASRHGENFQRGVVFAYLEDDFDAIHVGHEKVRHHKLETLAVQRGKTFLSILRDRDVVAVHGKKNF